ASMFTIGMMLAIFGFAFFICYRIMMLIWGIYIPVGFLEILMLCIAVAGVILMIVATNKGKRVKRFLREHQKICPQCGINLIETCQVCPKCGSRVDEAQPSKSGEVATQSLANSMTATAQELNKSRTKYATPYRCSWETLHNYFEMTLQGKGYAPIFYNGENCYKKGTGALTSMKFAKIEYGEDTFHISGWVCSGLGKFHGPDEALEGFVAAIPKSRIKDQLIAMSKEASMLL
ncbi:MAG: hypothetical protein Q4C25_07890, partial [Bacillota bacterium]|nr:hypothetical protein [Bacillota bacterium]